MTPHVENTQKVGKNVKGSHAFCISGVCDHKVSLMRHSQRMLKRASLDPNSTTVLPQYQHKNTAAKSSKGTLTFLYFSHKQTPDIYHLAH